MAGNVWEFIPSLTDPGTFTGGAWYGGSAVESSTQLARNPWWDVARGFHVTHRFADFAARRRLTFGGDLAAVFARPAAPSAAAAAAALATRSDRNA